MVSRFLSYLNEEINAHANQNRNLPSNEYGAVHKVRHAVRGDGVSAKVYVNDFLYGELAVLTIFS